MLWLTPFGNMFNGTAKMKYRLTCSSFSTYSRSLIVCRAFASAWDSAVSVGYTVIDPLWLKKRWSLLSQKSPRDNFLPLTPLFPLQFLFAWSYSLSLCRSFLNNTFSLLHMRVCTDTCVLIQKTFRHTPYSNLSPALNADFIPSDWVNLYTASVHTVCGDGIREELTSLGAFYSSRQSERRICCLWT